MTPTDLILMIAAGIRAGTIELVTGNAEIRNVGAMIVETTTLEEVGATPTSFTFACDVVMERKQKGVAAA